MSAVGGREKQKDDNVTEPLEEGEICDEGSSQQKLTEEVWRYFVQQERKKSSQTLKKRKTDSNKSDDIDKLPKRSKDVVHRAVEQRRCRVKIPMIGRPKLTDIPPSLPLLGVYEEYLHSDV